jgi:hypothetical protein
MGELYWSKYLGWKTVGWSLKMLEFGREEYNKMDFIGRQLWLVRTKISGAVS